MTERILQDYHFGIHRQELDQAVSDALGQVAACWEHRNGLGRFMFEEARQIKNELLEIIVQFAKTYPVEFKEKIPPGGFELTDGPNTMQIVYQAMARAGVPDRQIVNAVHDMQNNGIYFREVKRDAPGEESETATVEPESPL